MAYIEKFLEKINNQSKYDYSTITIFGTFNKDIFDLDKIKIIYGHYIQGANNDSKIEGIEYVLEFGDNIYLYLEKGPIPFPIQSTGRNWDSEENAVYSVTIIFQHENFEFVKILINKLNKSKNYGY